MNIGARLDRLEQRPLTPAVSADIAARQAEKRAGFAAMEAAYSAEAEAFFAEERDYLARLPPEKREAIELDRARCIEDWDICIRALVKGSVTQ